MYNIIVKDKERKSKSKTKFLRRKTKMEKRITARENFEAIKTFVVENGGNEDWVAFLDAQVAKLDAKAAKAKEKRAEKAAEPDPYLDAIAAVIGDEPITADEIVAKVDLEDLTRNKVTARIAKLEGVEKVEIKVDNGEGKTVRRVAYKRA
jgi:copper chaperone CopZ